MRCPKCGVEMAVASRCEAMQAENPVLILEFACRCRQCAGYGQVQGSLAVPQQVKEDTV